MAEVKATAKISLDTEITLKLTISEAQALEAICGYGPDTFVKWFYKNMGEHYLKPHENAMRSLFATVRGNLPREIHKIKEVQNVLNEAIRQLK